MAKENNIAIYGLFSGDKCFYIGSTNNPKRREKEHLSELANGTHKSKSLSKKYLELDGNIEFRELFLCKETFINRYILEYLFTSAYEPTSNKVFNLTIRGKTMINFALCDSELAKRLIKELI